MLLELTLRDVAVFEAAEVEPGKGLVVITGETGSGKSVLLGALRLLTGERADTDLVRRGAERAVVTARFALPEGNAELSRLLEELGASVEDGEIVLRREIADKGRSRCRVGAQPVAVRDLARVAEHLVAVHGQNAEQRLYRPTEHTAILDGAAGCLQLVGQVEKAHVRWKEVREAVSAEEARRAEAQDLRRVWEERLAELEEAALRPGEDQELAARLARLGSSGQIAGKVAEVVGLLSDDDGVSNRLARARRILEKLASLDPDALRLASVLGTAGDMVEEVIVELGLKGETEEADPELIDRLNARLARLQRLQARMRTDLHGLIARRDQLRTDLRTLDDGGLGLHDLRTRERETLAEWTERAETLSARRQQAARNLDAAVTARLAALAMPGAVFRTRIEKLSAPGRQGAERAVFELCPNPGEGWRDLAAVASGGEASRIMLALVSCLEGADMTPVLVFDEVDAGLGGEAAQDVASALRDLARDRQVIAVSHLHQLAAAGECHLAVRKLVRDGRTVASIETVDGPLRETEIARMLGDPASAEVRLHAALLLRRGDQP